MPGSRLAEFFGRVVRAESFRLIVVPAIADLQFECSTASRMRHARNHIGVWRAFVGALFSDFAWNAHTWLTDNVRRTPLHSHLSATWPALLLASYIACSPVFIADISTGAQKLSRGALIHNATLWSILSTALALLCISVFFVILGSLSRFCAGRGKGWGLSNPPPAGGTMSTILSAMRAILLAGAFVVPFCAADASAQTEPLPTQMITLEGRAMRIWTAGIAQRKPGPPAVILETGAGEPGTFPLDAWRPVFPEIARIAPVLAYERRGNGMSEADTERPTMRRVARVLHALLQEAQIAPPYILVGQSWGGVYIRAFLDQYPTEVAGMVFLDATTGMGPTREEKAAVLPAELRAAALAPPVLPPMPPNISDGLRAEFEEIGKELVNDGQETRTLRPIAGIPVAVLNSAAPGRLRGPDSATRWLTIERELEWILTAPNSIYIAANHVGHWVHRDDPTLVARLVKHVLDHVGVKSRDLR